MICGSNGHIGFPPLFLFQWTTSEKENWFDALFSLSFYIRFLSNKRSIHVESWWVCVCAFIKAAAAMQLYMFNAFSIEWYLMLILALDFHPPNNSYINMYNQKIQHE